MIIYMKKKKPKVRQPRVTWERKPMTQVKKSDKVYSRKNQDWTKE
jgi:hypothetical protein